jgi:hypothetical protein
MRTNPETRFWSKVDKNGPVPPDRPDLGPCWLWTAGLFDSGYAQFKVHRKSVRAHRHAFGAVDDELTLDHLCRVLRCVRPSHLEQVTLAENLRRAPDVLSTKNANKNECDYGHEFTEANTYRYLYRGAPHRACRTCKARIDREYKARKRAARHQAIRSAS